MKRSLTIISVCVALSLLVSCTKEGLGGDATLVVFLQHHTKPIINHIGYPDTVFIKFNAKELPGTKPSDFDTYFVGEGEEDHVNCKQLKRGDYYLYGVGFDSTGQYRVTGGIAVKIKYKERKAETDMKLAVTE